MRIRSLINRIRQFLPGRRWEEHSIEEWNSQYASVTWQYLASLEQLPRYAVIEAWRRRLKPSGSVLDLGCGEGVLFDQIPQGGGATYTGVDLSQVAIDAAMKKIKDPSRERFVCADLVTFEPPPSSFDVVVFNEVVYYLPDPVAVVRRYHSALAPDGLIIVSVFRENLRTWKEVSGSLAGGRLQETVVSDVSSGKSWYLGLYQAGPTPG